MSARYPLVPLGEVLTLDRDETPVEPTHIYRIAGMYSFGRGIFEREPVSGADMSYRSLFRLKADSLVMSRLNGWEGAIAVVGHEYEGCFVSNEYPTFAIDASRAVPSYLSFICRWPTFWEALRDRARGMGSDVGARRLRVHPDRLLEVEIPLPDCDEQHRVAQRLDSTLSLAERVTREATHSFAALAAFRASWIGRAMESLTKERDTLGSIAEVFRGRDPRYEAGSGYLAVNQACVRSEGIDIRRCREVEQAWWDEVPQELRVQVNDVLVNSTGEGTIGRSAVAAADGVGLPFDSHVLAVRIDRSRLLPAFLDVYLRSKPGQDAIDLLKSANTTKQTELGKQKLQALEVPLPPVDSQVTFLERFHHLDEQVSRISRLGRQRDVIQKTLPTSALNAAFSAR